MSKIFKTALLLIYKDNFVAFIGFLITLSTLLSSYFIDTQKSTLKLIPIFIISLYLGYYLLKIFRSASAISECVDIPYSICTFQSRESHNKILKQQEIYIEKLNIAWVDVQKSFRINEIDWNYFSNTKIPPEYHAWDATIVDIRRHCERYLTRIDKSTKLHFFMVAPEALAFVIGATLGTKNKCTIHQYIDNDYIDTETLHLHTDSFSRNEYLNIKQLEVEKYNTETTILIIRKENHELISDAAIKSTKSKRKLSIDINMKKININNKNEFSKNINKISNLITHEIQALLATTKFLKLCFEVPSTLAFILGREIGSNNKTIVMHYDKEIDKLIEIFDFSKV